MHAGLIVDRYQVERLVGEGGMAEVWAARHVVLGTRRALKVLVLRSAPDLVREGRLQARIDHPNVLPVLDVLEHDGAPVLVMPLVEGPTLQDLLQHRTLTQAEAIGLFEGILAGVEAAQANGVVHRDLKPANVLLQVRGEHAVPRVADFGIADRAGSDAVQQFRTREYAPPTEHGGSEDDYWALGVLLHQMLTGDRPHVGPDGPELTAPPPFLPVLGGLLDVDPTRRLARAADVRAALAADQLHGRPLSVARLPHLAAPLDQGPVTDLTVPLPVSAAEVRVPSYHDRFVGRRADVARLREALQAPGLVSVVGVGGVGKTRLATQAAHELQTEFPGGVVLVDLTEATTFDDVARTTADTLRVPVRTEGDLAAALAARGRVLVILDNMEQVADCGSAVAAWLEGAPEASLLVTTRVTLRVRAERVVRVDVLDVDDAVALFVDRARRTGATITPDADVTALVEALDRLPLAIELAAARAHTHSPARLTERLEQRFRVLVSRDRDVPERQRTLLGTLDWSWDLLGEPERQTLAQLSVFEGSFDLEAAEAVLDVPGAWVEDTLAELVEASLLRTFRTATSPEPRMRLLVSVHAYARRRLEEAGSLEAARGRHLDWFTQQASEERFDLAGGEALIPQARLDSENFRAAMRTALDRADSRRASAAATVLYRLVRGHAPFRRLVPLFETIAALPDAHWRAGYLLGRTYRKVGRRDDALHTLEATLAAARANGTHDAEVPLLREIGITLNIAARAAEGASRQREGLAMARERGARMFEGLLLTDLAMAAMDMEGPEAAERLLQEALPIHQEVGYLGGEAITLSYLAGLSMLQERQLREAERLFRRAWSIYDSIDDRRGRASVATNLAGLAFMQDRFDDAADHQINSIRLYRLLGDPVHAGRRAPLLARIRLAQDRIDDALNALDDGERDLRAAGDVRGLADVHIQRADVYVSTGRVDDARALLSEVEALLPEMPHTVNQDLARVLGRIEESSA